jgi:hypothetical protein
VGAELLIEPEVVSLFKEVDVVVRQEAYTLEHGALPFFHTFNFHAALLRSCGISKSYHIERMRKRIHTEKEDEMIQHPASEREEFSAFHSSLNRLG